MRRWTFLLCLAGCFGDSAGDGDGGLSGGPTASITGVSGGTTGGTGGTGVGEDEGGSTGETTGDVAGSEASGDEGEASGPGATTGELPPPLVCTYPATNYAGGMLELMVPKGSSEQLVFTVPGLPDPSLVSAATLKFVSWDADHPGEEGTIIVNGGPAIDLPADAAWENAEHATAVEVTGRTVAGDNTAAFGAGSFVDGTFYRVGMVAIEATVHVEACPEEPEPPPMPPKAVQIDYPDATYTQRHNWVHRCDFIPPYAYTAGSPHPGEDCDDLYMPDMSSKGKAIFTFEALPAANYKITISSRHSANRNPKGALFIVDGEEKRIDQTTGSDVTVDEWGTKFLMGTIEVVLDSSLDTESDSVAWVRLEPV